MEWLIIASIAYFIYAIVFIVDRILVTKTFKEPIAYAFYTGLLHGTSFLLIPVLLIISKFTSLGIETWQQLLPASLSDFSINILTGFLFFIAVYLFYRALFLFDTSSVVPLVGSLVPIISLILTWFFLSERLNLIEFLAFILLLVGGILISVKGKIISSLKCFLAGFLAALFFGTFYTLTEYIYLTQSFWSGFIWARIGTAIAAVLVLFLPSVRKLIFKSSEKIKGKVKIGGVVIGIHALGGVAFVMIHYAVSLSHVSLINALQGVQYVFLLLLILFLSKKFPKLLDEKFTKAGLIQKSVAILAIGFGLIILATYVNSL